MKYSTIIYIIIISILVSFFYIPVIIKIFSSKKELNEIMISIEDMKTKKKEFQSKLKELKNITLNLEHQKNFEIEKLKNLSKLNYLYMESIDEERSDAYLTERRNEEMEAYIYMYEKNNISSYNTLETLKKYFQSNKLIDYFNSRKNVLLVSSIIKNETDLLFLYEKVINPFFIDDNNYHIIGPPCYKATMDSNDPFIFHRKCKKIKNSIMLVKTNKTRFGGITEYSWDGNIERNKDNYEKTKTRLFNLDNQKVFLYNKNQTVSKNIPPIRVANYFLAIFGYNDLYLGYYPKECKSGFPQMFLKSNDTDDNFNDLLNEKIERYPKNKEIKFEYLEVEVYPINIKR